MVTAERVARKYQQDFSKDTKEIKLPFVHLLLNDYHNRNRREASVNWANIGGYIAIMRSYRKF